MNGIFLNLWFPLSLPLYMPLSCLKLWFGNFFLGYFCTHWKYLIGTSIIISRVMTYFTSVKFMIAIHLSCYVCSLVFESLIFVLFCVDLNISPLVIVRLTTRTISLKRRKVIQLHVAGKGSISLFSMNKLDLSANSALL